MPNALDNLLKEAGSAREWACGALFAVARGRAARCAIAGMMLAVVGGCGGGSGAGGNGPLPTPCAVDIRTCYVRANGADSNDGSAPDSAHALRTISRALQLIPDNYTVDVGSGTYPEGVTTDRDNAAAPQHMQLLADPPDGSVIVDATSSVLGAGIRVSNSDGSVIDGFTVINSSGAGIVAKSTSDNLTIRNCLVYGNLSDGIRVQDSANVLIFNNLVYGNGGVGIGLLGSSGSPNGFILNNTVVLNGDYGLEIGTSTGNSHNALIRNNIVQDNNGAQSIKVFTTSTSGYDENVNLVKPFSYLPATLGGADDIGIDALFANEVPNGPPSGFLLQAGSPAIDAGVAFPASVQNSDSLVQFLHTRTTVGGRTNLDKAALDLGFHFVP